MQSGACRGRPAYEQGRQNSPTLPLQALQFIWAGAWPTILWGGAPPPWPWPLALINSRVGNNLFREDSNGQIIVVPITVPITPTLVTDRDQDP